MQVGTAIEGGLRGMSPGLELVIALLLVPFIINASAAMHGACDHALQAWWFWMVDNILKKAESVSAKVQSDICIALVKFFQPRRRHDMLDDDDVVLLDVFSVQPADVDDAEEWRT